MEFDFDDDQRSFRDAVKALLTDEARPTRLRGIWSQGHDYTHAVWQRLAGLGLAGVTVSYEHGGSGGTLVDLTLALEECGYHAAPEPVVENAVIAPAILMAWSDAATQQRWLPRLAGGEALFAVAYGTRASIVPDGLSADAVLVHDGDRVHLVERGTFEATALEGSDPSRRLAECNFAVDDATLLSDNPRCAEQLDSLGAAGISACLVGLSQRMLDMTRDYLLTREQFGRVIGSFQALKHRLADVAMQTEAARSLAWYAMYANVHAPEDASMAAWIAKARANEAAAAAGSAALQLHGGIGFTWEHDLHLYLQRGRAWERAYGTTQDHRRQAGRAILSGA